MPRRLMHYHNEPSVLIWYMSQNEEPSMVLKVASVTFCVPIVGLAMSEWRMITESFPGDILAESNKV